MKEKTLLIIAAVSIIIGLPLLFFASNSELQETKATVQGKVQKVIAKESVTIAYVTTEIPVVYFEKADVRKGDLLEVQGKLQEYKGKVEFIAD